MAMTTWIPVGQRFVLIVCASTSLGQMIMLVDGKSPNCLSITVHHIPFFACQAIILIIFVDHIWSVSSNHVAEFILLITHIPRGLRSSIDAVWWRSSMDVSPCWHVWGPRFCVSWSLVGYFFSRVSPQKDAENNHLTSALIVTLVLSIFFGRLLSSRLQTTTQLYRIT